MNSVDVNDENRGVCPGGKQSSSVSDPFAVDQPTGRPSILRQTENLPSKTVPKGIKVCFQTPRRDPVTKRIVSPTKSLKMTSLDECTKALESLNLDKINASLQDVTGQLNEPTQEMSSYPDDNMPVRSKGGYHFDFDNLDAINPFQGSSNMVLSPAKPQQTKAEFALDETLPFIASIENSLVDDVSSSRENSVVTVVRAPGVQGEDSSTATPEQKQPADTSANVSQDKTSGSFLEDAPLPTKGAYTLDFDNLEDINPFQTGGPKIQNSPILGRKGLDITPPAKDTQIKETTPEEVDVPAAVQDQASCTVTAPELSPCVPQEEEASASLMEDAPLPPKGAYSLDFDTLDDINPFQTGGSKIQNSPVLGRKVSDLNPPAEEIKETTPEVVKDAAVLDQAPCTVTAPEPSPRVPQEEDASASLEDAPLPPKGAYTLDFDTLDNINPFQTGGSKIQNSPVLGRKGLDVTPPAQEIKETTPEVVVDVPAAVQDAAVLDQAPCNVTAPELSPRIPQEEETSASLEDAPLPPKGAYTLDFDTLDEINPFQTGGSKIQNSPDLGRKVPDKATKPEAPGQPEMKPVAAVAPISAAAAAAKEGAVKLEFNFDDGNEVKRKPPPKKFGKRPAGVKPKEAKPASDVAPPKEAPVMPEAGDAPPPPPPKGSYSIDFDKFDDPNFNPFGTKASMSNSPKKPSAALQETPANKPAEKKKAAAAAAEVSAAELVVPEVKAVESLPESTSESDEMFVPGTTFLANDFDGQIDYLEQFGCSSFKESALRKQSLYLKFDPLLRESPKKAAGPSGHTHVPRPAAFVSRLEAPQTAEKTANVPQKDDFQLFDVTTPVPPAFGGLVPPFSQSAATEDAIIEVLKYSQKDMDAAIARVQAEMQEKEDQWNAKYKGMLNDGQEMRKIIAEFELMIAKMMADQEQEKEAAQAKLKEALLEKEQVSSDLNAMERSFSDLFKRLEKYKAVVEGYKKNEETLKACAQDYLARIKKEEQRYQTLKAHAEEKIGQANEEIAEVRTKNKAEVSTLQAQLRREQLKVQSLERSLAHKEKEADELTKLVDELINKVQKG